MSWYLFGSTMALTCFGLAWMFGTIAATGDPPLWAALLVWSAVVGLGAVGARFIVDMVRNDRRVRRTPRDAR